MRAVIYLILLSVCASAGIIRLSLVATEETPGYSRHELGEVPGKQVIFIKDEGFITEADIESVTVSPVQPDAVSVTLSPEGTRKMIEVTTPMRPGIDRIAIVVDGKVLSAPVLNAVPLGKNFIIEGLKEKDEPYTLAGRLMGKSAEEIKREVVIEKERARNLPKPPPPVYYSDKEYEELRKQREQVGINYMDRNYTEEELGKLLQPGLPEKEVVAIFGKPNHVKPDENGTSTLTFETSPEKYPESKAMHLTSFTVEFTSGKLASWRPVSSTARPREPKRPASKPGNLVIKTPAADMSDENFDFVAFVEGIKISLKPGKTVPTEADYHSLISVLWSLSNQLEGTLNTRCDSFAMLAEKLPELKELGEKAKAGRIPVSSLKVVLSPYVFGSKNFP